MIDTRKETMLRPSYRKVYLRKTFHKNRLIFSPPLIFLLWRKTGRQDLLQWLEFLLEEKNFEWENQCRLIGDGGREGRARCDDEVADMCGLLSGDDVYAGESGGEL